MEPIKGPIQDKYSDFKAMGQKGIFFLNSLIAKKGKVTFINVLGII